MVLEVHELSVSRGARKVIDALTLPPIAAGELTVLAGPNAAGKSTLLYAISQLLPHQGRVLLDGEALASLPRAKRMGRIGFMPQHIEGAGGLSVLDSLLVALHAGGGLDGQALSHTEANLHALTTLERFGIADLAMRSLSALSGGQRQMVGLAQAVMRQPKLLLLDEPTSALDLARQYRLMSEVQKLARDGRVVVAVLHDLALAAQWADRIILMANGALLAAGSPEEVLTPANLARAYGISARIERCSQGRLSVLVDGLA